VHGCGSWGPQKETNLWWRLDFGQPVEIDKLILFLRAAWTPTNAPHDSWWKEATVEFSDGTTKKLELKQVATGQEFSIARRTVSWLVLKNLKPAEDKWCALCEFEAWGRDAPAFAYVADADFAAKLQQDPLVAKAKAAMLGFQRASWEQGVAGQALLEAGERDAAIALARASLIYVNASGVVAASGGSTTDPLMLGDCLWWSARQTGDPALVKAADDMLQFALKGAPRAADGTPYHQAASREMWSDGSFTTPPFLAAAGKHDAAIAQLLGVHRRLWDPDKKLMHHRWSEPKQALVDPWVRIEGECDDCTAVQSGPEPFLVAPDGASMRWATIVELASHRGEGIGGPADGGSGPSCGRRGRERRAALGVVAEAHGRIRPRSDLLRRRSRIRRHP